MNHQTYLHQHAYAAARTWNIGLVWRTALAIGRYALACDEDRTEVVAEYRAKARRPEIVDTLAAAGACCYGLRLGSLAQSWAGLGNLGRYEADDSTSDLDWCAEHLPPEIFLQVEEGWYGYT